VVRAVERESRQLGHRLRQLRNERDLTLEKAAERIGVHSKYLQRIELAKVNPALATLVAIAIAYGVQLHALFADEG
jgi:transcriptional regulator with XRE-family HTH domain